MKIVHEQILFDCLEQFEAGVSVEALMAKYPHAAAEIEKFLAVAAQLQRVQVQPRLAAQQQSQKLFLQQAAEMRAAGRRGWFSWRGVQRTLLPLASLAMVTLLLGATLLFASTVALPGDLLYDTKRWVETVQVQQATDATAVFSLKSQQNDERIRETQSLLRTNETAVVSFEGQLNTKQGSNWVIGGIAVQVTAQTQVEPGAEVGALLWVNGRTQDGQLLASQITVLQMASATATPAASATTTAVPTGTVTQTSSPTATTTASPGNTATPLSTGSPVPTGTGGGTPEPAATKVPTTAVPTTAVSTNTPGTGSPSPTAIPATSNPTAPPAATAQPTATQPPPTAVPPTPTNPPTSTPAGGNNNDNDNDNDNNNDNDNGNGNDNDNDNDNDDNNRNDDNNNDNNNDNNQND